MSSQEGVSPASFADYDATTYPDAGLPIEHVTDRHGYIWRVVRDGGMATRAHHTGLVTIGIAALEREAGPLTRVIPPGKSVGGDQ